jgi:hypothetical protein
MLPVQGRVVALVAGPGFGKTVLAGQLAAGWNGPVFWYTCDPDDRDLANFAAHLREMTSADARAGSASFPPPAATAREVAANAAEVLADRPSALEHYIPPVPPTGALTQLIGGFHDILTGTNGTPALPGYDTTSGVGTFDITKQFTDLPTAY